MILPPNWKSMYVERVVGNVETIGDEVSFLFS